MDSIKLVIKAFNWIADKARTQVQHMVFTGFYLPHQKLFAPSCFVVGEYIKNLEALIQ